MLNYENLIFDSNCFIEDEIFDYIKNNIKIINKKYHLLTTPQIRSEVLKGKGSNKDERLEEKKEFITFNFICKEDVNIFPLIFPVQFFSVKQLKIFSKLLYRKLSGEVKDDESTIQNYLDNVEEKKREKALKDCKIAFLANIHTAILVTNDIKLKKAVNAVKICKCLDFNEFKKGAKNGQKVFTLT